MFICYCCNNRRYWPDSEGSTKSYGDCVVTWVRTDDLGSHVVRELLLKHNKTKTTRTVRQVQYNDWPDHGVTETAPFLQFLNTVERVERQGRSKASPLMVHCSAGVGRTGVFMLLRVVIDKLKRRIVPRLSDILVEMRRQRMLLVQTPSQYEFCFDAAIAALEDPSFEYY
jgi:protein tyrosine phosphatase